MSPIIIGHRGVAGHYPENTLASIEAAIQRGLKWVEIDVQPTQDNVLIVCHDHTIDRCSNGSGRVDAHTLKELQAYDFGSWFDPSFAGQSILTLAELLKIAYRHQLSLNIEVKIDKQNVGSVAKDLKQLLDDSPLSQEFVVLSSFSAEIIRELHRHCAGYRLAVLSEDLSDKDWRLLREVEAYSCNLDIKTIKQTQIDALHQGGYKVWCYTVNEPHLIEGLHSLDGLFSDFPERFE